MATNNSINNKSASLVFSTTSGIIGTTTNDTAAAGSVGEVISSIVSITSPVSITSGVPVNVTSITLDSGQWDIFGMITFLPAATTLLANAIANISLTSATNVPDISLGESYSQLILPFTASSEQALAITPAFAFLNGSTTYYLVADSIFSVSTLDVAGKIVAVRRR